MPDTGTPIEQSVAVGFVRQLLNDVLGTEPADVVPHAMLVGDLGADSLDMIEIQMMLEEQDVMAPDRDFHAGTTVRDVADLILAGTCARCGGLGEHVVNTTLLRDPVNDTSVQCEGCAGTGSIHKVKGGFSPKRLGAAKVRA